jgi:PAS domain S-box-containing protein
MVAPITDHSEKPPRRLQATLPEAESTAEITTDALLAAALDCIILLDQEGKVVEFNPAAEQTFGYRRDEAIGKEMAQLLVPPALREAHRAGLARYLATGEIRLLGTRFEITGLRADGNEFPVELTITRLPSEQAPLFAGFLRDITARKLDERRLAAHHAVSQALVEAQTVEAMAAKVLPAIGENLHWELGVLWQAHPCGRSREGGALPPERCELRCTALWHNLGAVASNFEEITRAAAFAPGVGLPGSVWERGEAIWADDLLILPNFPRREAAAATGLRAALAFPIRQGDDVKGTEVVGVLEFFSRDPQPPDEKLLRVVEVIGNEVGQFLRRKRLEEELHRAFERQNHIATWLQDALRPVSLTVIPGLDVETHYQAALAEASIGGDFFDVFAVEQDCFALVVADLSGKGLAAAAQTATVRHMLRALLYEQTATLSETVTHLNAMLTEHNLLSGFATLFVGVYDTTDRSLNYTSCGQEPALLYRAATRTVEELGPTGTVLGGFPGVTFAQKQVLLAPGDVLAIFTDGLTEAGPRRREMLQIEGVSRLLSRCCDDLCSEVTRASATSVVSYLMTGVEEFAGAAGIHDDACLLVAVAREEA